MTDGRSLVVVLDTNQWRAQYGLRSRLGAALLYFVSQRGGRIGLPEVVEAELIKHLVAEGTKAVDQIEAQLRVVQALTGSIPSFVLPSPAEISAAVADRLAEMDHLLWRMPIEPKHSRRAIDRVNDTRSPNRKREQFKDSLIWEACLDLAADFEVHLVSADQAFFEPNYAGLAADLVDECAAESLSVQAHRDVAHVLEHLREAAPSLDYDAIAADLLDAVIRRLAGWIDGQGFGPGELVERDVRAFATQQLDQLALTFQLTVSLIDRSLSEGGTDRNGRAFVTGDASYDSRSGALTSYTLDRVTMRYTNDNGDEVEGVNVIVGAMSMSLGGPPPKVLEIRVPIDPD